MKFIDLPPKHKFGMQKAQFTIDIELYKMFLS